MTCMHLKKHLILSNNKVILYKYNQIQISMLQKKYKNLHNKTLINQ